MVDVLTDFYVKPYDDPLVWGADPTPTFPLYYYDNEDGFWDEYIQYKQKRWE